MSSGVDGRVCIMSRAPTKYGSHKAKHKRLKFVDFSVRNSVFSICFLQNRKDLFSRGGVVRSFLSICSLRSRAVDKSKIIM